MLELQLLFILQYCAEYSEFLSVFAFRISLLISTKDSLGFGQLTHTLWEPAAAESVLSPKYPGSMLLVSDQKQQIPGICIEGWTEANSHCCASVHYLKLLPFLLGGKKNV